MKRQPRTPVRRGRRHRKGKLPEMRSITETLTFQATVSYESILDIIHIGKELCHDLRSGATPPVVLGKLQNTGFAAAESQPVVPPMGRR